MDLPVAAAQGIPAAGNVLAGVVDAAAIVESVAAAAPIAASAAVGSSLADNYQMSGGIELDRVVVLAAAGDVAVLVVAAAAVDVSAVPPLPSFFVPLWPQLELAAVASPVRLPAAPPSCGDDPPPAAV